MENLKCSCELCLVVGPKIDEIRVKLKGKLKKDFDYLMMRMMVAEHDRDVLYAQLHGQWRGFEWIIEARKKAGYK